MIDFSGISTLYLSAEHGSAANSVGLSPDFGNTDLSPVKLFSPAPGVSYAVPRYDIVSLIYALRRAGNIQPLTVKIMDKRLFLDHTVEIPADIEGVTFEPYGERAEITGGYRLTDVRETTYRGLRCFAAEVPASYDGAELFVNGIRADDTRYPESGFLSPDPETVEVKDETLYRGSMFFSACPGDLDGVAGIADAQLHYYHRWIDGHTPITSFEPETRRITLARHTRFSIYYPHEQNLWGARMQYWLTNIPEAFGKPNQWYFDKISRTVYYIPRDSAMTPDTVEMILPVTQILFNVHGNRVGFRNLTFSYTTSDYHSMYNGTGRYPETPEGFTAAPQSVCDAPGALCFTTASDGLVEHCTVIHTGLYGILIGRGCTHCRIAHNTITDLGAGGIRVEGGTVEELKTAPELRTSENIITQNTITHGGVRHWAGCGVLLMHTDHDTVSHNEIADFHYSGISCGWVWGYQPSSTYGILIEKNHIHHIGYGHLSDLGGIYLLAAQPGTVVRGNVIHHIRCEAYGGNGIYTDEGASSILIEDNLVYEAQAGYLQHFGRQNVFRRNIVVQRGGFLFHMGIHEIHTGMIVRDNLFVLLDDAAYIRTGHGNHPVHCMVSEDNIFCSETENPLMIAAPGEGGYACRMTEYHAVMGADEHSRLLTDPAITDRLFIDAASGNYTLREDSPARAAGFRMIDIDGSGVTK